MSNNDPSTRPKRIFSPFEIFWHWAQTLLIFGLLFTGLEMSGIFTLTGFESAFATHITLAWMLIGLWILAIFWHVTTGEWRNYMPTGQGLMSMLAYYAYGIFSGESKPYAKTAASKHNPLQRLAYFFFKAAIAPALWISGLLLLFYNLWRETLLGELLPLAAPAAVHVGAALALMVFLIVHIYLASTTGNPWYAYLRAMVTGYSNEHSTDSAEK
ncbi:cytochrome b/b6 domain-containing protein [Halorhodospira halochloris]|uniref:cytochrome b/b6 domain-containing protein n=1 Tax=Halorhodospira halochloris TaxID=1052 RepID=UPI001EE965BA|nr:cytochrome b/b6 domain-containing protein [Halorhodospira halochloris]